jgi:hypothetical protein
MVERAAAMTDDQDVCTKTFNMLKTEPLGRECDCGHHLLLHSFNGCAMCRFEAMLNNQESQPPPPRFILSDLAELVARLEICIREEEQAKQQLHQAMARTRACRCDIEDLIGRAP